MPVAPYVNKCKRFMSSKGHIADFNQTNFNQLYVKKKNRNSRNNAALKIIL